MRIAGRERMVPLFLAGCLLALVCGAGEVDDDLAANFVRDRRALEELRQARTKGTGWTESERLKAAVLARRLLAFAAAADERDLRENLACSAAQQADWVRLADVERKRDGLDPLVSLFLNSSTWLPGDETPVRTMKTLKRDYNLRRFMFDPPGLRHACGKRGDELYVKIGESFAAGAKALQDEDVVLGWFDRPTLAWNHHTKCQHVMDCDGNVSSALCPLDREGTDRHIANVKRTVEIGRPRIVIVEDDLNLSGHSGLVSPHGGCFCPLHMAAFAKRIGRMMTAKEAGALFDDPTEENASLRKAFAQVSKESLVQFCRRIRAAIDEVDPTIRICLCQSAQVDIDGDTTEADVRALAGDTRPMTRIYGANYLTENVPAALPKTLAHTFYSMQHVPRDVEMIYEADSFPHTRFYNSSLFYASEIAAAFMAGAEDLLMFCVRTAENPLADTAFLDVVKANRARFAVVRDFRRRSSLVGVRAVYHANERAHFRVRKEDMLPESARVLAKFGFPMTTLPSKATVLFGATAERTPVEELREIFKGAVIVDSTAALALTKRGLGVWLFAAVSDDDRELLVMVNNLAGEPRPDIALEFSRKWRGGKVERLARDGMWQAVGAASDEFQVEGLAWPAMTPEFLKVTKK